MKWFRLYSEARTDAKLRSLSAEQFRVWFNLLCFAAEQQDKRGAIAGFDEELLAIEVANGDTSLLAATLDRLQRLRILQRDGDDLVFTNFHKRQFDKPSDAPDRVASRVSAYRDRQRNADVTPCNADVTPCNADVTPCNASVTPDTEAEGEAEAEAEDTLAPVSSSEDVRQLHTRARAREAATATGKRMSLDEFVRRFADAAGLAQSERGAALEALIEVYRPMADDKRLILEAAQCASYYAERKPKRAVNCRLLGGWLQRWSVSLQQQEQERNHHGQPAATAQQRRRHAPSLPDPTRTGRYPVRNVSSTE